MPGHSKLAGSCAYIAVVVSLYAFRLCAIRYTQSRELRHTQSRKLPELPELSELTERSREFLLNVTLLLRSKLIVDKMTMTELPREIMAQYEPFKIEDLMKQKNVQGTIVTCADELFEIAKVAEPKFKELMRNLVLECKLDPDEEVKVDGKTLMIDNVTKYKVLTLASLKSEERCFDKVKKEYDYDWSKLVDVVRCSIVLDDEDALETLARALCPDEIHHGYKVVQLKNRFKKPVFNGYRDALYNILVDCGGGMWHVCEVQIHLAAFVAFKETTHKHYEYFRVYFSGSRAEEKHMNKLAEIGKHELNPDAMVASVLDGTDIEQLELLGDLLDLMGDVKVALLVRKRLKDLVGSLATTDAYAQALQLCDQLEEAGEIYEKVLQQRRLDTLASINNLATLKLEQGDLKGAEPLLEEVRSAYKQQLSNSDPDLLKPTNNLAIVKHKQCKLAEAEPLYKEVLDGRQQILGSFHPDTLMSRNNLAVLWKDQGKMEAAEDEYKEVLSARRKHLGNSHLDTLMSLNNLAGLLIEQRRFKEAEPLHLEALPGFREQLGDLHLDTLMSINSLAALYLQTGKLEKALPLLEEALSGYRSVLKKHSCSEIIETLSNLAILFVFLERLEEAAGSFQQLLSDCKTEFGPLHARTLGIMTNLARVKHRQGKLLEAELLFNEALEHYREHFGNSHPDTLACHEGLKSLLKDQSRLLDTTDLDEEKRNTN